jgi:hypothetical protein
MNLNELVEMRGFDINRKIKLVRHKEKGFDINSLYKQGMIDIYQSIQSNDVFRNCDYLLSFLGIEESKAIYIGAYEIGSKTRFNKIDLLDNIPDNFPYIKIFDKESYYKYQLNKICLLEDMIDRLVIDWGRSTINWHRISGLQKINPNKLLKCYLRDM